ncbi:MAG: J domain-containing protein [Saprospiraceae bacterium]
MEYIDYYAVLEIPKTADEKEIKKAYRRLARKYHPDLNKGDQSAESKFKQVNEANEVLSDPEKRKKYDKHGKDWMHADEIENAQRQQRSYQGSRASGGSQFDEGDFSEYFESMFGGGGAAGSSFGGGRRSQARFKGQDYHAELTLNLSEVTKTQKQTVTVNGKNLRFSIPAGIKDQQSIVIKSQGGLGANGGPAGDLYLKFNILNDTSFKREGDDLHKEISLDLYKALLGGEIFVDTLDGKVKINVPAGTQNDAKVKLKGKGFPVYKEEGKFGDLYIKFKIMIPTNLSQEEQELFVKLSKMRS